MHDDGATLLLTRPAGRSEAFLGLCEKQAGRRLPAIISPIMEILPVGDLPDLSRYRTLILTSASAVDRMATEGALKGRQVATVGDRTAELAAAAGARSVCLGASVEDFVRNAGSLEAPCLHCRGVHARGDLASRLTENGIPCDEAIVYDQIARPLNTAARALLASGGPVVLPLFSPRSAELVSAYAAGARDLRVIAMSAAVAEAWKGGGAVSVAQEPTGPSMVQSVMDAF